jgi:hypothetical protein
MCPLRFVNLILVKASVLPTVYNVLVNVVPDKEKRYWNEGHTLVAGHLLNSVVSTAKTGRKGR